MIDTQLDDYVTTQQPDATHFLTSGTLRLVTWTGDYMAWGSISLFGGFLENENSLETMIVIFENVSPKGSFWPKMKYFEISVLTANSPYLQKAALKIRRRPGDNENVKKSNRFNNQNNFARASRFFVYFFAVTARLRRENAYFHFLQR